MSLNKEHYIPSWEIAFFPPFFKALLKMMFLFSQGGDMMLVPLKDSQLFKNMFLSKTKKIARLSGSNS